MALDYTCIKVMITVYMATIYLSAEYSIRYLSNLLTAHYHLSLF